MLIASLSSKTDYTTTDYGKARGNFTMRGKGDSANNSDKRGNTKSKRWKNRRM